MISLRYTYNALQDFKIIRDANGNIDFPGEHFPPVHIFPEGKSDLSPAHVILYSNMGLVLTYMHTLQHRDPLLLYRHPCLKRCVCVGGYATCVCVCWWVCYVCVCALSVLYRREQQQCDQLHG